jgi:hypothetical protein
MSRIETPRLCERAAMTKERITETEFRSSILGPGTRNFSRGTHLSEERHGRKTGSAD